MNHKQKALYTLFGAAIMLMGLSVGSLVCPPVIALKEKVLDEIYCTGLTVINSSGEPAIVLRTDETLGNGLVIHTPRGEPALLLVADETANSVAVTDKSGEPAVLLRTSDLVNRVIVRSPLGKDGVRLSAGKVANRVTVSNPEETNAVQLYADEVANRVTRSQPSGYHQVGSTVTGNLNRIRIGVYLWISKDTPFFYVSSREARTPIRSELALGLVNSFPMCAVNDGRVPFRESRRVGISLRGGSQSNRSCYKFGCVWVSSNVVP